MTTTLPHPDDRTGGTGRAVCAYLPLRYVLTESLVVRSTHDPLRITTEPVVNGRAQRGMLAAALRHAARDDLVEEWIARGDTIRFAPAFPRLEDADGAAAALPAPRAWHAHTPAGAPAARLTDLVDRPAEPGTTYRILGGLVTPDLTRRATPITRTEQYLGTARAGEGREGVPFFTTSLEPGQVFEARWQLRAATLADLRALASRVLDLLTSVDGLLSLGSGGTRAHGGGIRVDPCQDGGDPLTPDRVDHGRHDWAAGQERDLLLLAPALLDDDLGRACPAALPDAAAAALADSLGRDAVRVVGAHVDQRAVGAYHRMYRGPMAERWAAAPGSVVRLRALRTIPLAELRAAESVPLGRRVADGHGAFALLPIPAAEHPPADRSPLARSGATRPGPGRRFAATSGRPDPEGTELWIRPVPLADGAPAWVDPEWVAAEATADPARSPVARLQDTLLHRAAVEPVRAHARALARRSGRLPAPGLLRRLTEVASAPAAGPAGTLARLAGVATGDRDRAAPHPPFTGSARRDAAAATVPHGDGYSSLPRWLEEAARTPAAWWERAGPDDCVLAAALTPVDLAWRNGTGLSASARAWRARPDVAARLALLLVGAWLAAAALAGRDPDDREEGA